MKPLLIIRLVGLAALSGAAVLVTLFLRPTVVAARDYAPAVTEALAGAELNEMSAESAPQQQVVNGWVARDLLEIIALENNDTLELADGQHDDRPTILLMIAVLAICWLGASSTFMRWDSSRTASSSLPQPPEPPVVSSLQHNALGSLSPD